MWLGKTDLIKVGVQNSEFCLNDFCDNSVVAVESIIICNTDQSDSSLSICLHSDSECKTIFSSNSIKHGESIQYPSGSEFIFVKRGSYLSASSNVDDSIELICSYKVLDYNPDSNCLINLYKEEREFFSLPIPYFADIHGHVFLEYSDDFDNIIWHKIPEKSSLNAEGEKEAEIRVNGDFKARILFNNSILKANQIITTDSFGIPSYVDSTGGGFSLFVKDNKTEDHVYFWVAFKEGTIDLKYDLFNQNYSLNSNNVYDFHRESSNSASDSQYKNWGLLRCVMENNTENWGDDGV